jgi:hypothetical protein
MCANRHWQQLAAGGNSALWGSMCSPHKVFLARNLAVGTHHDCPPLGAWLLVPIGNRKASLAAATACTVMHATLHQEWTYLVTFPHRRPHQTTKLGRIYL